MGSSQYSSSSALWIAQGPNPGPRTQGPGPWALSPNPGPAWQAGPGFEGKPGRPGPWVQGQGPGSWPAGPWARSGSTPTSKDIKIFISPKNSRKTLKKKTLKDNPSWPPLGARPVSTDMLLNPIQAFMLSIFPTLLTVNIE